MSTVMQDFVFGPLEADTTTLEAERGRWSGIRHHHDIVPLDPLPDQPVTIRVTIGRGVPVDHVTAYVTTDGSEPAGHRGQAERGFTVPLHRVATLWQPLYWDYAEIWEGEIPGQPEGTHVRYVIEGWHSREPVISERSREMNLDRTVERPAIYGYSVDRFRPPAWAHEAVVYQIFVDRFAPVPGRWLEPEEMTRFIGGNLAGILDHLDYIADLGVTAIWLTPIFACHSYHGYDTLDYGKIDPRFGDKDDLRRLVDAAHARGLRIILDFVANHVSVHSAIFRSAHHDPASPYRRWFSFGPEYPHGYRTFFTTAAMPQLNLDEPEARAFLLAIARYWLTEFAVDGYRLDYAAGPSHDFWSAFGAACKAVRPDCWLFGEVTLGNDRLRTYVGRLDGCLDFGFTRLLRRLCTTPAGARPDLAGFVTSVERNWRYFPAGFTRPCFLDNHDMNRFLWVVGNDKDKLRLAATLLFGLGGSPILYYGTEVGLSQPRAKGPHREEARHPMLWGQAQDRDLLAFFRRLIGFRRQHPALAYGEVHTLRLDPDGGFWLAERVHEGDRVFIALNVGAESVRIPLPAGVFVTAAGERATGAVTVPPNGAVLLG
jgi:glycosidase